LTGGRRPPQLPRGYFYEPPLLTDIDRNAAILREECFGPALPIVVVDSLDEAIEQANDSVYGLGSSIWTHDLAKAQRAARRLEAGMTWINCHQESNVEVPFGGVKESGVGRELGYAGLAEYLESKTIVVNYQPTPKF
jgi:succinate-semialdehyde dehydrogenase/glutarate-semialdehyde dehydrogenase